MSSVSDQSYRRRIFLLLANVREMGIFLVILILIPLVGLRNPNFLATSNFRDILLDISILSIVAIGQMMVIVTASIDLSVGSIIGHWLAGTRQPLASSRTDRTVRHSAGVGPGLY